MMAKLVCRCSAGRDQLEKAGWCLVSADEEDWAPAVAAHNFSTRQLIGLGSLSSHESAHSDLSTRPPTDHHVEHTILLLQSTHSLGPPGPDFLFRRCPPRGCRRARRLLLGVSTTPRQLHDRLPTCSLTIAPGLQRSRHGSADMGAWDSPDRSSCQEGWDDLLVGPGREQGAGHRSSRKLGFDRMGNGDGDGEGDLNRRLSGRAGPDLRPSQPANPPFESVVPLEPNR